MDLSRHLRPPPPLLSPGLAAAAVGLVRLPRGGAVRRRGPALPRPRRSQLLRDGAGEWWLLMMRGKASRGQLLRDGADARREGGGGPQPPPHRRTGGSRVRAWARPLGVGSGRAEQARRRSVPGAASPLAAAAPSAAHQRPRSSRRPPALSRRQRWQQHACAPSRASAPSRSRLLCCCCCGCHRSRGR